MIPIVAAGAIGCVVRCANSANHCRAVATRAHVCLCPYLILRCYICNQCHWIHGQPEQCQTPNMFVNHVCETDCSWVKIGNNVKAYVASSDTWTATGKLLSSCCLPVQECPTILHLKHFRRAETSFGVTSATRWPYPRCSINKLALLNLEARPENAAAL